MPDGGGVLRLAACRTGIPVGESWYAQGLANELKALGAESVVIAPEGFSNVAAGEYGIPQVRPEPPPGGERQPLLPPGKGWGYYVAEEGSGWQLDRSALRPGAWKGAAIGSAKFAAMMALSYLHAKAVARRRGAARLAFRSRPDRQSWLRSGADSRSHRMKRRIPFSQRFEWRRGAAR